MDPAVLRYFDELLAESAPAAQRVVQNVLDEPIPEETQARLKEKPLRPKPFQPRAPPRQRKRRGAEALLREYDPLRAQTVRTVADYQREIQDLYDDTEKEGEEETTGRRFIRWRFIRRLGRNLTAEFMAKIRAKVSTSFYLRHVFGYQLRHIEDGTVIVYYSNPKGSQWYNKFEDAETWLNTREEERLDNERVSRPNTKWAFEGFFNVDVKVVLDREPLVGTGPLPDWLRNLAHTREMVALDVYRDNLCLWRCLAVHQGARTDRCTREAKTLAKSFYELKRIPANFRKTSLDELDKVERHLNAGKPIKDWQGFRVYEPERLEDGQVVWHLRTNPPARLKNIVTIGVYEGHAFLIKDIVKLAKTLACTHCGLRFTQACHLQRHHETCSGGETVIWCPGAKVEAPQTAYEKAMYQRGRVSKQAVLWLEWEAKRRGIHIHHAMCEHGGERWLERDPEGGKMKASPVDGYHHETKTVFQYHGCSYHGCRKCFPDREQDPEGGEKTVEQRYKETANRTAFLRNRGYKVIEAWKCEVGTLKGELPRKQTRTYPHAIFYDFEAYGDGNQRKEPTGALTIERAHVPISVSIGDTLEKEPTHICERNPAELITKFMKELERRERKIGERVREEFLPTDMHLLPKDQQKRMCEWCNEVPVVGFNSGAYDLNLIKSHFAGAVASENEKVRVAKKGNKTMFLLTSRARFLDFMNYLGPGTSYEKWVKAYGSEATKSWFPYEWFDRPEKLDNPGLPEYEAWYSKLKGGYVLTRQDSEECQRVFKEKEMRTFADWLRYYNNLDVGPGLEALERMKSFYTERGIDILKDAVSLPGVSLHYVLRGAIERGEDLWSPDREAYGILKRAVVGGPSLVFTRYHEAGVTRIREQSMCQKIVGYDANALYLATMLRAMPCGRGRVKNYIEARQAEAAEVLVEHLKRGEWFGFAEVDIEIPKPLRPKFAEMCPFFENRTIPAEAVPEHMQEYLVKTGRKRGDGKKLVGALSAERMLVYAPLLRWYVDHGAVVTRVYKTIDYNPGKPFTWFVEQVTEARRTGDVEKSKALLAEVFKLLGNSAYGKLIEALERQTNVIYTKDEKVVDRALRSAYFEDLDEIGKAYELKSRKPRVTIRRPFQIGIAVYQLAKLRMLEFYYDFLDKYVDRKDFELIQMDTDSSYMAISGESLEDVVRLELKAEFEAEKREWLAWDKWSGRTPGLFKQEFEGSRMIALCSKCYFADEGEVGEKQKFSTKGMSKRRTSCPGSGSRKRWKGAGTWRPTGVSGCGTARWSHTSRRSWG